MGPSLPQRQEAPQLSWVEKERKAGKGSWVSTAAPDHMWVLPLPRPQTLPTPWWVLFGADSLAFQSSCMPEGIRQSTLALSCPNPVPSGYFFPPLLPQRYVTTGRIATVRPTGPLLSVTSLALEEAQTVVPSGKQVSGTSASLGTDAELLRVAGFPTVGILSTSVPA